MALTQLFFIVSLIISMYLAINASASDTSAYNSHGYIPKPDEKPKLDDKYVPAVPIGVQGLVYCKRGSNLIPLEGAVARITCLGVDEYGYESDPISILSHATDKNGFFLATLYPSELVKNLKLSECKAFLESSPLESCNVPCDFNKGISGALLELHRILPNKKMNLYSVGPFHYTAEPNSVPKGY